MTLYTTVVLFASCFVNSESSSSSKRHQVPATNGVEQMWFEWFNNIYVPAYLNYLRTYQRSRIEMVQYINAFLEGSIQSDLLRHSTSYDDSFTKYSQQAYNQNLYDLVKGTKPSNQVVLRYGGEAQWSAAGKVFAVNRNGDFGPVCNNGFDINDADVVCRQLGFDVGFISGANFPAPDGENYSMDEVDCVGNEPSIQLCAYSTNIDNTSCGSDDVAEVSCYFNEFWE